MNIIDIEGIYWKNKAGETVLLKDLPEEEFQKAYQITQKRQLEAYSSLEMNAKMENALSKIAKRRKINLISLDEVETKPIHIRNKFTNLRDRIDKVNKSIKIQLKKDVTAEN